MLTSGYAADPASYRSLSIPIGEFKHILINWLDQSGLDVIEEEPETGKVELQFQHNGNNLIIGLKSESALATQMTLLGDDTDPEFLKFEEELYAFINSYMGPNQNEDISADPDPFIPKVIYSKIGSAVCINTSIDGMSSQFSGFVIDYEGTIICTAHDLKKYKIIKITDQDGKMYLGKVVKLDLTKDLALVQSQHKPRTFISLSGGREYLKKKELIYAIGCPMNKLGRIITGRVTKPPVKADQLHYWQVSLETSPGSSGSPVFDEKGALVGIVKGRFRGTNTIGFLIPISRIKAFIDGP
jgi:serine protease Do